LQQHMQLGMPYFYCKQAHPVLPHRQDELAAAAGGQREQLVHHRGQVLCVC
jgi:hypothetical protein